MLKKKIGLSESTWVPVDFSIGSSGFSISNVRVSVKNHISPPLSLRTNETKVAVCVGF